MSERKLPPADEVIALLERGLSTSAVARQYGATRQAVTYCLRQNDARAPRAPMVQLRLPWQVRVAHNMAPEIRKLRILERIRLGLPVSDRQRRWAEAWAHFALVEQGQVVDYDPQTGFSLVPRRPEDGDGLVRR